MRGKKGKTGPTISTCISKLRLTDKRIEKLSVLRRKTNKLGVKSRSKNEKSIESIAKTRRSKKIEQRKREKKAYTAQDWAAPIPSNLVAKLDVPKVKTKYQSYFEFAENPEKKRKKLEFKVTNNVKPPSEYVFVPIGDPALTNACKELSRENEAMVFIVSNCKEDHSKISEHVYRIGFHFKKAVVDEAIDFLGERKLRNPCSQGHIEPIPVTQEEINRQADAAIRDLFPRIPNTDRQVVIEHAFKKGAMYQGEPTVGTQPNIPLSRRVQLAVLAHIRHNHTRYDKLLRETSWINARKAVEPLCLDIILKWRGDEENGRDQMDEILREVVIITDSESENEDDHSSSKIDSSEEEAVLLLSDLSKSNSQPESRNLPQSTFTVPVRTARGFSPEISSGRAIPSCSIRKHVLKTRDRRARRGFKRYQAAWDEAVNRQKKSLSPSFSRLIPEYPSQHRKYFDNKGSHSSLLEPVTRDTSNKIPFYSTEDRLRKIDEETMKPSFSYSIHHDTILGSLIHRNDVIGYPNYEHINYFERSIHQKSTAADATQSKVLPLAVARCGVQDVLVESIEKASDEILSSRTEGDVSDRFNYTSNSRSWQSGVIGQHEALPIRMMQNETRPSRVEEQDYDPFEYVPDSCSQRNGRFRCFDFESIEATSIGTRVPQVEEEVFDRFNSAPKLLSRWSYGTKPNETSRHEVITVDDGSPQAGSRYLTRHLEADRSKMCTYRSHNTFGKPQNNDSNHSATFLDHFKDVTPENSLLISRINQGLTHDARAPDLNRISYPETSAYIADTNMNSTPHYGHLKLTEARRIPEPHVEYVDLTSGEPEPISERFPARRDNKLPSSGYRQLGEIDRASFKKYDRSSISPLNSIPFEASLPHKSKSYRRTKHKLTRVNGLFQYDEKSSCFVNDLTRKYERPNHVFATQRSTRQHGNQPLVNSSTFSTGEGLPLLTLERSSYARGRQNEIIYDEDFPVKQWNLRPRPGAPAKRYPDR
ncbi:hypothetical protein GcM3_042001 [Golovinomyces cichoracearum]|uniref:DUF2293 domain-containing protein n=1 Tax=Golovinomyces cichoracearum TaxID=62708 RepID=A0A420J1U1_9PEZI|nr:hypothetical protein GcM3_042001 [Golovinomyces cichoracearum]